MAARQDVFTPRVQTINNGPMATSTGHLPAEQVIPVAELVVVAVADDSISSLFLRIVLIVEAAKFNAAPISD
ncbi:hypothetical protein TNCV_4301451 [Trichonephila clavipes]|uniref:Uncharacterized protein n=1 Tax=Trichonephila clavipes TaxID=2585209 RepID=A0A8X6RYU6_TRICX|nr:hypothetical protein TNCV_4301221 [Trichonephila clavipes]GFX98970.1 hypothetical protein TNCV_4301451 [Trichonephila clavipes]